MAKDFLGNEIHVGDIVCYVDYTKTKSWMDIARIEKINKSGVTLKIINGLTKASPYKFKHSVYRCENGHYKKVGERIGRFKRFDKIVKYFPFPDSIEREKPSSIEECKKFARYLRIEAEDSYYEEDFMSDKKTNIYAALSNESHTGIEVCIDLKTHQIIEPEKVPNGNLYIKACDRGKYTLLDEDFFPLIELCGYCPNKLVPPSDGYGDYIDLEVENNVIINWYENPSFEEFRSCIK